MQTGLHKILERVKSHEDAWPFADPVDEKWAPRYYAVVRKPMHLRRMEEKLEAGEYLTFSHFKADFMQIVENCRKYNGSDNEYTEMVENLKEVFQRAADRYLESDLSSDEDVAIEFPPPAGAVPGALPGAKGGAVGGEDVTSPTVKKEEPEEEAEEENEEPKEEALEGRKRRRKRLRGGNSWKESEAKRHTDEDSVEEEEEVKTEVTVKEEKVEKKEDRKRGDKRKSEEKVEEKKEDKKEDRRRKEEEKRKEEEVEKVEKVEKKGKGEKIKEEESKDEEEKLEDTQEELEEERYSSHRKRRKKVSESEGNEKKRKGQRPRRGADTEEEQIEEKKPLSESATHTEEEEEEGNTSGSKKKESAMGGKRSKSKPKKTAVVRNAAAIDALAEATEQTLKDINKWLDETPRLSEFSSASNSPSHLMSAEEYDAVGKGIESEYRKSLRMCDPTFGDFQQKDHGRKDSGPAVDKKGVRVDKRKPGQGAGAASSVSLPKRTIIERLQPGKSKGNLLKQGRSNSDADSSGGSGGVVGSGNVADEPSKKPGEATPKLSLGTVLRGDIAFGEGTKKEPEEAGDEEEEEKTSLAGGNLKKEKKQEEEKVEVEEKVEEDKPVRKKMGSATPNLSAWFKAFGAPRGQGQKKKGPDEGKGNTSQDEGEKVAGNEEPKLADEGKKTLPEDDTVAGKVDPEPLSPSPSGTPHSTSSRQRHVSTGSSNVSDLSSAFSPDVQDPALSPRLVELPSHSPSASAPLPIPSTYAPVNGTIRVGFYQDTSQKSGGSFSSNGGAEEGLPSPTHSGSSVLPTVPMQSSDMQFYDTSKPLTDQYREVAARVHHQHQHPPAVPTPPPVSPSPPASASPPRPMPYPNTPSVIFSTGSNRVTSPTYLPPVYPPPASNTITSYAPTVTTTTNSFSASESGPATTFPVKKRLYSTASTSSSGSTSITESSGTSVLVAPTCSSPVGRPYHSPEPQVSVVQHTTPLVRTDSPPPYDCSTTGTVPGYPHAHLETSQPKLGFARLPIYHHHPELSPLNPQHPGKPEPLRSVLHHPSMSPRSSDVQPSSPPRTIEPIIPPYPVEHQRRVLDLTGSVPAMQPTPAPPARTKTKTTRKTKTGRQQQQRQEPSELPVEPPGFQQFTRKSPEPLAAGLQQPQHPSSSAFEFAARLSLYGRDGKNFQHLYRAPIAPPSTGYYVDPGSMVKSPPPPSHQQPQPQHSQPLTQGCPPQGAVGSALPSYPFPISPHYPHYHPHHRLDTVPPKSQYLPSSPPPPSSSASPTSVPSSSPTTSASPIPAPSIPASLLSSAPPSFHPSNLSALPTLPGHRTFCTTGNGRASGSRLLAFPQGQQREGGSIVPGGGPLLVDPASPLYQQYHHHSHPHLHPPTHHLPQEELLLRGAAPLAPYSTSGYQHAFDPINRPWH
ncbi:hypothetical protein J437_LFUL012312 [Ladona fulva]|uniref:Bromo domain-containing protein n=1 Tax=Ladona fulva TaxID=123851 RepID=A0A8K0KCF8_LADFU|nr:hypothetical protein J437_LFUL012312 [Ladona fulva]